MKQPQRPPTSRLRTSTSPTASGATPSLPGPGTPARCCGGYRCVSFECLRLHKRPATPAPAPSPFAADAQVPLLAAPKLAAAPRARTPDASSALDFVAAFSRYAEHQGVATPTPFGSQWASAGNCSLTSSLTPR